MAERLMIFLVSKKSYGRQEAHEIVRQLAQEAFRQKIHLKEMVKRSKIGIIMRDSELDEIFNPETYIGEAERIVEEATKQ